MAANLTLANKNPFSTFDFLGYFIPGAFAIGLIYILSNGLQFDQKLMPASIVKLRSMIATHQGYVVVMLVLLSYVIGHLISYLSSITIEQFYIWCYGYPTDYLLLKNHKMKELIGIRNIDRKSLWHAIICLLLLPLFVCHFLVEKMLGVSRFLSKGLDDEMRSCLIKRINELAKKVQHKEISENDASTLDIHRIVMHYVYEHCQQHIAKYDNYVALYGFLRSITLIFNLSLLYVVYRFFRYIYHGDIISMGTFIVILLYCFILYVYASYWGKLKEENTILSIIAGIVLILFVSIMMSVKEDVEEISQMILLMLATYISYLGYTKFYRRFTLENLMSLLVCKEFCKTMPNTHQEKVVDG